MPEHGVGELADHHRLERSGDGNEQQHGRHAQGDEHRGQQGAAAEPRQVAGGQL